MSRRIWVLALLLTVSGCGKNDRAAKSGEAPMSAAAQAVAQPGGPSSELWTLAPDDAVAGVVVADGALHELRAGLVEIDRILRVRPDGVALADRLRVGLRSLPIDVLDASSLASMGVDLARGAALFVFPGGETTFVLPIGDRAAFRRGAATTTETIDGREVDRLGELLCAPVGARFACAATAARLTSLGTAPTGPLSRRVAGLPGDLRGEIEAIADLAKLPDLGPAVSQYVTEPKSAAAAVTLAGGSATLRLWLEGTPSQLGVMLIAPPSKLPAKTLPTQPAGLFRLGVSIPALLLATGSAVDRPIGPGVTLREMLGDLTGELIVHAPSAADPLIALEIGLQSLARATKLLDLACAKLSTAAPGIALEGKDGRCAGTIDLGKLAALAGPEAGLPQIDSGPVPVSLAVEPERLRVEFRAARPRPSAALATSPIGRDLALGQWGFAMWGQAVHYNLPEDVGSVLQQLVSLAPGEQLSWLPTAYFALLHVYELGFAIGSRADGFHLLLHLDTFAGDPEEVYRDYEKAVVQALDGDLAAAQSAFTALARRAPDSRVGHQMTTRGGGGLVAVGAVGILAAVSVPAFIKYVRRSKSTETRVLLHQIMRGAERYRAEHGTYPPSAPLTPADPGTCCQAGDKCPPDPAQWQNQGWIALGFAIADPHFYAYQFENLGDQAIARAIGDLDCDGEMAKFELRWSAAGGQPQLTVENELE